MNKNEKSKREFHAVQILIGILSSPQDFQEVIDAPIGTKRAARVEIAYKYADEIIKQGKQTPSA